MASFKIYNLPAGMGWLHGMACLSRQTHAVPFPGLPHGAPPICTGLFISDLTEFPAVIRKGTYILSDQKGGPLYAHAFSPLEKVALQQ